MLSELTQSVRKWKNADTNTTKTSWTQHNNNAKNNRLVTQPRDATSLLPNTTIGHASGATSMPTNPKQA
jgi:hypothetical protein